MTEQEIIGWQEQIVVQHQDPDQVLEVIPGVLDLAKAIEDDAVPDRVRELNCLMIFEFGHLEPAIAEFIDQDLGIDRNPRFARLTVEAFF